MSMSRKKEEEKEEKTIDTEATKGLLEHYSNEICSHVEAAVSLFFGLIGNLILITITKTVFARIIFSISYFLLGLLGVYFYFRLFYYRKLLEGILLEKPFKDFHVKLESLVFEKHKLIRWTNKFSRLKTGKYRMGWAWLMLGLAGSVAILSWIVVILSL